MKSRDGAEEGDRLDGGPATAQDTDVVRRGGAPGVLQCLLVGGERVPCSNFVTVSRGKMHNMYPAKFLKCPGKRFAFCMDNLQGDTSGRIVGMGWVDFDL